MTPTPEERAREIAFSKHTTDEAYADLILRAICDARNAALEEAAAWVREYQRVDGKRAAEGILALKDKPARDVPEVTEEGK